MVESLTDATIQQLNLGYDAEHDRLLLKVGLSDDAEIPVWLTRRVVKLLWLLLQGLDAKSGEAAQEMYTHASPELLEKFVREAEAQQQAQQVAGSMQFGEAYEPRHQALSNDPLLIQKCRLLGEQEGKATSLELATRNGDIVRFNLNLELRLALGRMLQLATQEADWGLKLAPGQFADGQQPTPSVLH